MWLLCSSQGIFVLSLFWQNESSENETGEPIRLGDVVYRGLEGMCRFPHNDRVISIVVSVTSDRRFEYRHVCLHATYSIKAKPNVGEMLIELIIQVPRKLEDIVRVEEGGTSRGRRIWRENKSKTTARSSMNYPWQINVNTNTVEPRPADNGTGREGKKSTLSLDWTNKTVLFALVRPAEQSSPLQVSSMNWHQWLSMCR